MLSCTLNMNEFVFRLLVKVPAKGYGEKTSQRYVQKNQNPNVIENVANIVGDQERKIAK